MNLARIALAVGSTLGVRQVVRSVQDMRLNDVLGTIGLQRRRSTLDHVLPALGWIGLGTAIGAGVALVLAPSSGKELRARVSHELGEVKSRVDREIRSAEQSLSERLAGPNNGGPS